MPVPRRDGPRARKGAVRPLFSRTVEEWEALGAPESLYDEAEAARCERDMERRHNPPESSLSEAFAGTPAEGAAIHAEAMRWWSKARPWFLSEAGALTAEESAQLDRQARANRERGGSGSS